ncbi:MAG: tyrosine-type recombinase/integrase [Burkholderiales bacterium]
MAISKLPNGKFRLQIRRKHLRVDEVFDNRADAEAKSQRLLTRAAQQRNGSMTLREAWTAYHADRKFLDKKATTRRGEETHIKPALAFMGGRTVGSINPDDIEAFITHEQFTRSKAADTVRNEISALSAVLVYCRAKGSITTNPCVGVKRPAPSKKLFRMSAGDEGALMLLLKSEKFRFRAAARLCLLVRETGARPGEWANAQWSNLDLARHRITFTNTKYKNQPRTIPLTEAALTLLSEQLEDVAIRNIDEFGDCEFVFPAVSKQDEIVPMRYSGTIRDLKTKNLLPKHLRPHSGRHELITKLVEDSDIEDSRIMALVGHHSHASMQIYAHARAVRLRPQLEALEDRRRVERTQSAAEAVGLPTALVASYLETRRHREGGADVGNELLFDGQTMEDLSRAAKRLGQTPQARLAALLKISRARPIPGTHGQKPRKSAHK